MRRRDFLAAGAATLAMPAVASAQRGKLLKFIPQSDVTILDPIWTTAYVSRNHGLMVFDTLYGMDEKFQVQPQMAAGHVIEDDGKRWTITLREGLEFHDGEKVLAKDCVASIRRWGRRDALAATLMAATEELSAPDDKTIVFRLKRPYPLLTLALGKSSTPACFIMPERLANTDPFKQVMEMTGSGPYRFKADERVVGARVVYEKNTRYRPREGGTPGWIAGPKVVNFDRVEWVIIPDEGTAASALQTGEVDWWEYPTSDLLPALRKNGKINVQVTDPTGSIGFLRMNCLIPPFDNPAIRRALQGAVNQADFVAAIAGDDPKMGFSKVGVYCPGTEYDSAEGMEVVTGPRDLEKVRREIKAAGYNGEKVVLLVATDVPFRRAMGDVGAEMLKSAGLNVEYQAVDWGTMVQRRENKGPPDKGGWNALFTNLSGADMITPAGHSYRGDKGWIGWPDAPEIEKWRKTWLDAPDAAARKAAAVALQKQWYVDAPQINIGQWMQPQAWRNDIQGVLPGFGVFWNVRRTT